MITISPYQGEMEREWKMWLESKTEGNCLVFRQSLHRIRIYPEIDIANRSFYNHTYRRLYVNTSGGKTMTKKMTVVFHDEELYTELKMEAVRRNRPASEIVCEAVLAWLQTKEDEELIPLAEAAIADWEQNGGFKLEDVNREIEETRSKLQKTTVVAEKKNVRH
jgi:hypothetical protein